MDSFQDLNLYGNTPVDYNSSGSYTIVFGNNAGNVTQTKYQGEAFLMAKQVPLVTFTNPSRDLLLNLTATPANSIITPVYLGSNPNIAIYTQGTGNYAVTGVRSVANYDDIFANLYIDTPDLATDPFVYTVQVNDQFGNTRTWSGNITLTVNPGFSIAGNLTYDEDTKRGITNITLEDPGGANTPSYNLTFSTANANVGLMQFDSGVVVDPANVVITKNVANISMNTFFQSGHFKFIPGADYTGNTQVQYVQQRSDDGRTWIGNVNLNIGNTHSDYAVPGNISYGQNKIANLTGISITDIRPNNIDANIQYTSTLNTSNTAVGYFRYLGTDYTTLTLGPNTKTNLNTIFSSGNIKFIPGADYTGNSNTTITYSQVQNTNGINQVANVAIPVRLANTQGAFSTISGNITVAENSIGNLGVYKITDIRPDNIDANIQYELTFAQVSGGGGAFVLGNLVGSPLVLTGNKTYLNDLMAPGNVSSMQWRPTVDFDGGTTLAFQQRQLTDNILQTSIVGPIVTVTNQAPYTLPTNPIYYYQGTVSGKLVGLAITDNAPDTYPGTTYTVTVATSNSSNLQVARLVNISPEAWGDYQNSHSYTGTKAQVNTWLQQVAAVPVTDFMANGSLLYTQTRTIPGIGVTTQANQVSISITGIATNLSRVTKNFAGKASTRVFQTIGLQGQGYTGSDVTLTVTTSNGTWRLGDTDYSSTYTQSNLNITGTTSLLDNSLYFVPASNIAGNATYNLTINRAGTNVINYTGSLTFSGNTTYNRTNVFSSTGSFGLSYDELRFGNVNVLVVGGGAGGLPRTQGSITGATGGGGGGAVQSVNLYQGINPSIVPGTYTFTIGQGGNSGQAGGGTFFYAPDSVTILHSPGGNIGNATFGTGGTGGSPSGGRGGNVSNNQTGGAGVYSTLSGSNVAYGGGGGAGRTAVGSLPAAYAGYGNSGGTGGAARADAYYAVPGNITLPTAGSNGGGGGGAAVGDFGPPFTVVPGGAGGNGVIVLKVS